MEKSSYNPRYLEQLENIEFYRQWIKDTFDHEATAKDILYDFHDQVAAIDLTLSHEQFIDFYDIDTSVLRTAVEATKLELADRIAKQLAETAEDLQTNIFDAGIFDVFVVIDGGEEREVEGVMVFHGRVVPIIDGQPYHLPIEGILF